MPRSKTLEQMLRAADSLRDAANTLRFALPVACVYNPLEYAWPAHAAYLKRYATTPKRVVFLGMNPGPFGMAQTGVPFGEVSAVRDWLGLRAKIGRPALLHPKRPITGFDCPRKEVSGRRLWQLFAARFGSAEKFFAEHFVLNYCPLVFMEESGGNRTPDKFPPEERAALFEICDRHLRDVVEALAPEWLVGIGEFAARRARELNDGPRVGRILHPSPASPAANKNWAGLATAELERLGVWRSSIR